MSNRLVTCLAWLGWILVLIAPGRARADDERAQLLAVDGDGTQHELPLVQAAMQVEVRGPIAQVRLTQRFSNPSAGPIEAIYVFPLHEDSAVGAMTMRIGPRTITAEIRKRAEARAIYDQAKRAGKSAALLEQERPNVFTQSVTGILPGETIDVELVYDVLLEPDDDTYELALPTVVGPRYNAHAPDAERISPPIAAPGRLPGTTFTLALDLDAGQPVTEIDSPTHAVTVTEVAAEHFQIALDDVDAVADKDFVLRWRVAVAEPTLAVLAHKDGDLGYATVVVQPPPIAARPRAPRELVFVVDTSGSMEGEPLALAKQAMRFALTRLRPDDRFRILNFSTDVAGLDGGASLLATRDQVRRGLSYVNGMVSEGGTEMLAGIHAALDHAPADGRVRDICFMTDGYIGNETEILAAIRAERPAGTHLFSFGVGSSVNRYLLDEMARQGEGVAQILLLDDPPQPQIDRFYQRLEAPMWSELHLEWDGLDVVDATPAVIPVLFAGRPVVVSARYRTGGTGVVRLRGVADGKAVSIERAVELPARGGDGAVLGRLWARRRIRELSERLFAGPDADAEQAITDIALAHALATQFTSFVAVDRRARVATPVDTVEVPVESPEGVTGQGYGEVITISGSAPIIDQSSTSQGITISGSSSIEGYFIDGINTTGRFPSGGGGSGWARGEVGVAAAAGVGGGGPAAQLHVGIGLATRLEVELGVDARATMRAQDRTMFAMLLSLARWSIFGDLGLRLGAGASSGWQGDLGAAWRAELVLPLPRLGFGRALPVASFGLGGTTAGDDRTDVGVGLGLRF